MNRPGITDADINAFLLWSVAVFLVIAGAGLWAAWKARK